MRPMADLVKAPRNVTGTPGREIKEENAGVERDRRCGFSIDPHYLNRHLPVSVSVALVDANVHIIPEGDDDAVYQRESRQVPPT